MTTREEISGWFDQAIALEHQFMVVVCDTFDHSDYPVFCKTEDDARATVKEPGSMQRVMEVYDLRQDKSEQMNERRAWRLPSENAPYARPEGPLSEPMNAGGAKDPANGA